MIYKLCSILIGYIFGCFLTADIVAKKLTGNNSSKIGTTGNPGMANIMANLGFVPGIIVLAGDVGKSLLSILLSWLLFSPVLGKLSMLYAGLGSVLGHNFPFWRKFNGGKGVSCTCISVFLVSPLIGFFANIAGMLVVFATKYLCLGAVVIPAFFTIFEWIFEGIEYGLIGLVLTIIMFIRHFPALKTIPSGQCEKVDVLDAISKHIRK